MARRQSLADQSKRIEKVCCPVHGIDMYQSPAGLEGVSFSLASCTRQDCGLTAIVDHFENEDGTVEVRVRQLITGEQIDRLQQIQWAIMNKAIKEANEQIDAELRRMASEADVQLPIAG